MFTEDYYKMSWQKGGHCKDSYRILKVPDNNLPCRARLSGYEPRTTAWGQTVLARHHPGMNRSLVRRQEAHVKRHPVILHHHHPAFCLKMSEIGRTAFTGGASRCGCHSHSHRCGWRVLAPWGLPQPQPQMWLKGFGTVGTRCQNVSWDRLVLARRPPPRPLNRVVTVRLTQGHIAHAWSQQLWID